MSHDQPGWSARLQLNETELVWEKPMRLDLAAGITLQDTRPIVAILGNIRGKHDWIGKLLTADGLTGHLDLLLDDQGATIRDSRVLTDQVGIRFKGRSDPSGREAMLFVRYGQLAGALSQEGEQRRFSIIKARAKFDAYTPGETPLDTAGGDEVSEAEAAARSAADQESGAAASGGDAADSTDLMQREKGRSTKNEPTGSAFLDNEN